MNAALALGRFGLGHRPDQTVPADPKAWLRAQLSGVDPAPGDGSPGMDDICAAVVSEQEMRREKKLGGIFKMLAGGDAPVAEIARAELVALMGRAATTPYGFRERLVWFWANHFSISHNSLPTTALAGHYVRTAIRPYVTGPFSDMLMAVMHHPAMLAYLNQNTSVGPDSQVGLRHHVGLNENLARESLELHTVSPASGYSQADVTNYARILTGWSVEMKQKPAGFRYRAVAHEPGEFTVMGRQWPAGEEGGRAILAWLATHPATYHHLAEKLVRHFVADDPPPADVARIEQVLAASGGNLGTAALALVDLPGAWVAGAKLRTPQDYVIACLRAICVQPDAVPNMSGMMSGLGEGAFAAPFPIGWPDRAQDWANPDAMLARVDFAYGLSARVAQMDPEALGRQVLGPLLTPGTLAQMRAAGSRRDGITLLFASPEFQRR